ncbi:hypothetical protein RB2654_14060 [Rhodobacterales bacterium HTCC2654]|uniref:Uncharacterized protein n=1 Tax=Maritimibacter alkaliphilus HTCC2654 TaxID=314271 RepID=A3VGL1_9RHOB|nr:hypothetical protein RB2654_14060 [Rhodobacterales bacterium HTCC2654] [Maritimibacter alkaliphilus HTCC2654]
MRSARPSGRPGRKRRAMTTGRAYRRQGRNP